MAASHVVPTSLWDEVKNLLKQQQQQIIQLTTMVTRLQGSLGPCKFSHRGLVISRRCRQPGHFARECTLGPSSFSRPPRWVPPPSGRGSTLSGRSRKTSTHQIIEPRFGWGLVWLRYCIKLQSMCASWMWFLGE